MAAMGIPTKSVLVIVFAFFCLCFGEDLDEGCVDVRTFKGQRPPVRTIRVLQKGNIYSPGFELNKNYPDFIQCQYQLQAPVGKHVRIRFNFFDIDVENNCQGNFLEIYDFDSQGNSQLTSKLCGSQTPHDYVSQLKSFHLVFKTDEFAGKKGFNITYWPQDSNSVCLAGQKQCGNRKCVEVSAVCDGKDDCGDGTDEEKCPGVTIPTMECGKPEINPVSFSDFDRIVGGKEAVPGSWPWMVSLQMKVGEPSSQVCGGSLINAQWVLSAAHCFGGEVVKRRFPSNWRIHIGSHNRFKRDPGEQVRYVERIIIYDDIPSTQFERDGKFNIVHDLALIKLNAPVKFNKYVKPICLPDPLMQLNITSKCYATGWGMTRGSGSSHALKQAYHPVQPDILCQRRVGSQFVSSTMICAGSLAPLNGVCHGDSGGPLVCQTRDGKWSIAGVASYVTDGTGTTGLCGLEGRPSVFNKVAVKNTWIQRMINKYG